MTDESIDSLRTFLKDEIICPYCHYVFDSSWEFKRDSGDLECYECYQVFHYERQVDVSYTTVKIKEK